MCHYKYSVNPWIQSKIWLKRIWKCPIIKICVSIFLHSTVKLLAWKPKDNSFMTEAVIKAKPWSKSMDWFLYDNILRHERVNVFSPSIHWDNYSRKKELFLMLKWQMLSKFRKSVRNCQYPILWCNHQNMNFCFCFFLLKY